MDDPNTKILWLIYWDVIYSHIENFTDLIYVKLVQVWKHRAIIMLLRLIYGRFSTLFGVLVLNKSTNTKLLVDLFLRPDGSGVFYMLYIHMFNSHCEHLRYLWDSGCGIIVCKLWKSEVETLGKYRKQMWSCRARNICIDSWNAPLFLWLLSIFV